jgi:hypothetical protein
MSTPRYMQAEVKQGSVLLLPYTIYIAHFADDNCLYATDCKEGYAVRKIQRRAKLYGCLVWKLEF